MTMTITTEMILCIAAVLLGAASLLAALYALRLARLWRLRCLSVETGLAALRRELEHVTSINVKAGRRLKRIEEEFSGVAERVEQVELQAAPQPFARAIDSARRGTDSGKLALDFGLSRGEADLVALLHGRKRA